VNDGYNTYETTAEGFGSMTDFNGNVGEGDFQYEPLLAPVGDDIPW
jgi:hypothetical protein